MIMTFNNGEFLGGFSQMIGESETIKITKSQSGAIKLNRRLPSFDK
jgi:hypothetical protein